MQNSLYKLFEHKCVLEVCVHIHPIMIKSLIYINASMFAQIIRDPALSIEEVSIKVFYESLQIVFPNNVLVSQFRG